MEKNKTTNLKNWHRADIVAELKKRGWSVRQLSIQSDLHYSTLYAALVRPYPKAERIIANALELNPEEIWPERYAARAFKPTLKRTHVSL